MAFHKPLIAKAKKAGIAAIAEYLHWLYVEEEAEDALEMDAQSGALDVSVHYCPAVKHLKIRNVVPYESFERAASVVYDVIAKESGLIFEMTSYDRDTGAANFRFET